MTSEHDSPSYEFDAFTSYSTVPDYKLAQKTEAFLESFHSQATGRRLKLRALKICVDGSDFSLAKMRTSGATDSTVEALLYEHLARCRLLVVFCSRASAASKYVDKEIEWWLQHRDADSVLLVVTEGEDPSSSPNEVFSERIRAANLHSRPWYDLRGFRGRASRRWSRVRDPEAERAQLAAHLYGETAGRLYPTWQREHDRRRRNIVSVAAGACLCLVGVCVWLGWTFTDSYQIRAIAHNLPKTDPSTEATLLAALARSDNVAAAQERALKGGEFKVSALNAIGASLLSAGRRDLARSTYELILQTAFEGQALIPESEILANSILLGVPDTLVAPFEQRSSRAVMQPLANAAIRLAEGGMFDRAVILARSIPDDLEAKRAATLIDLSRLALDDRARMALLDEAWTTLKPFRDEPAGLKPDLVLRPLAAAYAKLGRVEQALEVAGAISFENVETHLDLAEEFAHRNDWPAVQRAARGAGTSAGDFARVLSMRAVAERGTVNDVVHFAEILEPKELNRGRLLLETAKSYKDPVVATAVPSAALLERLVSDGSVLIANSRTSRDPDLDIEIAQGWLAAGDGRRAEQTLAAAVKTATRAKRWDVLSQIVPLFIEAGANDGEFAWIDGLPSAQARADLRRLVAVERRYGADGKPLRDWVDASKGGGDLGGPYEQWFQKSVAAANVNAALEASRGIDNEGRRAAVMLAGVRDLLARGSVKHAYTVTNAIPLLARPGVSITFDEDKFLAIADVAPALARHREGELAETAIREITDPRLRARALGRTSVALMPTSPARARKLLDESIRLLGDVPDNDGRQKELTAIAKGFCEQADVDSTRAVLANVTADNARAPIQVCIVRSLLKAEHIRVARLEADSIASPQARAEAYISILNALVTPGLGPGRRHSSSVY